MKSVCKKGKSRLRYCYNIGIKRGLSLKKKPKYRKVYVTCRNRTSDIPRNAVRGTNQQCYEKGVREGFEHRHHPNKKDLFLPVRRRRFSKLKRSTKRRSRR